jgi:glycine dehydrogenase
VSLQPNAGSQGEYAGLLTIRAYHDRARRGPPRHLPDPQSRPRHQPGQRRHGGHGGVVVACDDHGNVDVADLRAKAEQHADKLAALMVTYPSTHGVFEETIREICEIIHAQRRPGLHGRRQHERAGRL